MENRIVKFVFEVEYSDWYNDDLKKWMPPTWEQVYEDAERVIGVFGDDTIKVVVNDEVLYDASKLI
jgi:arabinogalactan endo-1,4-beta-galactosidase